MAKSIRLESSSKRDTMKIDEKKMERKWDLPTNESKEKVEKEAKENMEKSKEEQQKEEKSHGTWGVDE